MRVVVTGLGIVSSIGNNAGEVTESLRTGRSGIVAADDYRDMGFRSHVHGAPKIDLADHVDRKLLRFMGDGAAYNYIAMEQAIADAGLAADEVSHPRSGLVMGSGGPSTQNMMAAFDLAREKGPKRVGPYMVPRVMSSTNSANLSTAFQIKGLSYSISSACSTSAHCIGNGAESFNTANRTSSSPAAARNYVDPVSAVRRDGRFVIEYNDANGPATLMTPNVTAS